MPARVVTVCFLAGLSSAQPLSASIGAEPGESVVSSAKPQSPAQPQSNEFFVPTPSWSSDPSNWTHGVAFGDVDGDGHLDLVCANEHQSNTLYLNENGVLAATPSWSSGPANWTLSVAVGDVDGDGDLDLVCGNVLQSNTLYANKGGRLEKSPSWMSDPMNATQSVALGDVDGDGDLDLVCGNLEYSTLYLNVGGVFERTPAWTSDGRGALDVALGDVDGDGDLDLVCGNFNQSNTLYVNVGGVFERTPSWSSNPRNWTEGLALGDVDGDGDMDLVCGNVHESNTLYLNEDGVFDPTPSWFSDPKNRTSGVALGDVDLDGDLDLVCGNGQQSNTFYVNAGGVFDSTPSWSSGPADETRGVALADVDGDGALDLACANQEQSNTLYLNAGGLLAQTPSWSSNPTGALDVALQDLDGDGNLDLVCASWSKNTLYVNMGGVLETSPSWSSESANRTQGVALGDVDGDGDPDLVCGNLGQGNTLYLNVGGVFEASPSWSSGPANRTYSVALGDVDGDGDLDLVCGNSEQKNTLYKNSGGVFEQTPSWLSGPSNSTKDVAFGDVDGDGDLDLVCGNWGENTLYLNTEGVLEQTPSWSGAPNATESVALGDVDGDGDMDLACGNQRTGQSNTLYLNSQGRFEQTPSWVSTPVNRTNGVALGDVDRDGDLDLVCGNWGENTLYRNTNGTFEQTPSWSSVPINGTQSVVLGDVNGDGNADLVAGNSFPNITLYESLSPFGGELANATRHLPNNPAHLRRARVHRDGLAIHVQFEAYDVESDPIHVTAKYQFLGEPRWFPVQLKGFASRLLATSPGGTTHRATVNTRLIPFDHREVVLRLQTVEIPSRVSLIQHAASSSVRLGRVTPARPQIAASTERVDFATVTVGDTVSALVTILNQGTDRLVVEEVALPSLELRHHLQLPDTIEVGRQRTMRIDHMPIADLSESGDLLIRSNDPFTPVKSISTQRRTKVLAFTRVVTPAVQPVPLGEQVTVVVVPADSVRIERGSLHFQPLGLAPQTFELVASGNSFSVTVPGERVTELGFEYWIEIRNDPVVVTDPPGAPETKFKVPVEPPSTITTQAVSGSDVFTVGASFRIDVHLQRGALIEKGCVNYRRGGEIAYQTRELRLTTPSQGNVVIPAAVVTERGVEYWVEVTTQTGSLADPPERGNRPRVVRTTIQGLREAAVHPGRVYRMVSVPMDFTAEFAGTLETLLSDQPSFGPYDPMRWRSFRWLPGSARYEELVRQSSNDNHRVRPGRAFWLVSMSSHQIATNQPGRSTRTDEDFEIVLSPGWNQIGNPFAFAVAWDNVVSQETAGNVEPPLRWSGAPPYRETRVLEPFDGYFVMNNSESDVVIGVSPIEASPNLANARTRAGAHSDAPNAWRIGIEATSCGVTDWASAGLESGASRGWDALDRSDAPGVPGRFLSVYFPHSAWRRYSKVYSTDVRSVENAHEGESWQFDVSKNFSELDGGDPVELRFDVGNRIPRELHAVLLDRTLGREMDLRDTRQHSFILGTRELVSEPESRFVIAVGDEQFVHDQRAQLAALPLETRLFQNQPNPFRHGTRIRYELASRGPASLTIYDVRGRLVRAVRMDFARRGRYELLWDGRDDRGRSVSAGLFLYRLDTPHFSETRKLLVVR